MYAYTFWCIGKSFKKKYFQLCKLEAERNYIKYKGSVGTGAWNQGCTYHDIEFWVQDFAEVNEFFLDLGEKFQTFGFFLLVDKYSTHYMIDEITWQWAQKKLAVMIVHSKKLRTLH